MKCRRGLEVQVLRSGAGYYIGTMTEEEGFPEPMCRISSCYYKTELEAARALTAWNFPVRNCIENDFCNHGMGCGIEEEE